MRQAVVIIHGIGEQKPMQTLRPFVEAVLGNDEYYSKPDPMSELFDLRRLQPMGWSATHFFEYYWASRVEGTKVVDVLTWLLRLIRKRKKDVPVGARGLWRLSRLMLLAALVSFALGGYDAVQSWFDGQPRFGIAWLAVTAAVAVAQYLLVYYLGDAARYLSRRPRNVQLRQQIRKEGVALLRTLHDSREYDRIVVVGHSLGSVIGYDVLTYLWQEHHKNLPALTEDESVQAVVRKCMAQGHHAQPNVRLRISRAGERIARKTGRKRRLRRRVFRRLQRRAFREQRFLGNTWRVSDFVTMGSPLTHAMLLLASSDGDFEKRKEQRELVTCPPQRDEKGYTYALQPAVEVGPADSPSPKKFTPLVLHHAAPFAVTRWTNLYFRARLGLFGDFVGGPLAPALGAGIRDVEVTTGRWKGLAKYTLAAHTSYWHGPDAEGDGEHATSDGAVPALKAVRDALRLNEVRNFRARHTPLSAQRPRA